MVYFGHPVLLRTSGISYRILPERTVRRLGIKCRVVNKSLPEATLTKCHHRNVHHSEEYWISSWVVSTQFSMKSIETNHIYFKSIKHRLPYFITHKLINLNWFSIYQLLLLYSTLSLVTDACKYDACIASAGHHLNLAKAICRQYSAAPKIGWWLPGSFTAWSLTEYVHQRAVTQPYDPLLFPHDKSENDSLSFSRSSEVVLFTLQRYAWCVSCMCSLTI